MSRPRDVWRIDRAGSLDRLTRRAEQLPGPAPACALAGRTPVLLAARQQGRPEGRSFPRLDARPPAENGDRVLAHGRITVYPQRGDLQFVADFIRPEGVGIHAARLGQLKEKLDREGLFDPARKRPLPRFPRKIGVVTSPTGAALQDIRQVLAKRWPLARLVVAGALVQGDQAVFRVLESDDLKEGFAAFHEKREPRFTGR